MYDHLKAECATSVFFARPGIKSRGPCVLQVNRSISDSLGKRVIILPIRADIKKVIVHGYVDFESMYRNNESQVAHAD